MGALAKSLLLFVLNWLDAQLTLLWVHSNIATEGNGLMGQLLKVGDAPFMLVKLLVGAFAAYTLYRCSHLPLARGGMRLRSEEHTSELQSPCNLVCRLLLEKK